MSTHVHLLLFASRNISVVLLFPFTCLIVINFLFALQTEHAAARQKLMDDQWLLEKCGQPDFYMRLKQHTDLCESVEANARRNILLHSVTSALQKTQLCGFDSCGSIAQKVVDTLMRGGLFMLGCIIVMLITIPCMIVVLYRNFVENLAEVKFSFFKFSVN
jgi:hypothetical protein